MRRYLYLMYCFVISTCLKVYKVYKKCHVLLFRFEIFVQIIQPLLVHLNTNRKRSNCFSKEEVNNNVSSEYLAQSEPLNVTEHLTNNARQDTVLHAHHRTCMRLCKWEAFVEDDIIHTLFDCLIFNLTLVKHKVMYSVCGFSIE